MKFLIETGPPIEELRKLIKGGSKGVLGNRAPLDHKFSFLIQFWEKMAK